MTEVGATAGFIIALVMGIIVLGVLVSNTNTDAILGSATASVGPLVTLAFVAFSIAGIGIIALVGKYIIGLFS